MTEPPFMLPAATLLAQLQALPLLGLDMAKVRSSVGAVPEDPDALVSGQQYLAMWFTAQTLYGAPGLPTALGMAIPFGAFGAIDYLAGSAATVEGCVQSLVLHFSMVSTDTRLEHAVLSDDHHCISVRPLGAMPPEALEFTLAVLINRLRFLTNGQFTPLSVGLPVPQPPQDVQRPRMLGAPIIYDCPAAMLHCTAASWKQPILRADTYLHATMTRVAGQLRLANATRADVSDLERALRLRLRDALAGQAATAQRLAPLMGMSERTLQRRLADMDRSFSSVVEEFRRDESLRLLSDTRNALAQIASRLGYAEQTSFTRAFRRWTGTTPGAWRTQRGL